jgi:hypothetical protein
VFFTAMLWSTWVPVAVVVLASLFYFEVEGLGFDDAQDPKTNFNELQYPEDALWANPGDLYSLTPGLLPSPRVKNTMTYVDPLVVVMGGYDTDGSFMDDIHIYDTRFRKWSGVILKRRHRTHDDKVFESMGATEYDHTAHEFPSGAEGDLPVARAEHAATNYDGMVYVFGGVSSYFSVMNDFYKFDPVMLQWHVINHYAGNSPPRRAGHSLVTDHRTGILYLYGGRGESEGRVVAHSDVWAFDVTARAWTWASGASSKHAGGWATDGKKWEFPLGRQHAAAALMNGIMFISGGIDPASKLILNDVWAFYCAEKRWVQLQANSGSTSGYSPPPLYHSFLVPVQSENGFNSTGFENTQLLLYGGVGGGGSCGGRECDQLQTTLGQVYRLPINYGIYDIDESGSPSSLAPIIREGFAGSGVTSSQQVEDEVSEVYLSLDGTEWSFTKLSDNSDSISYEGSGNVNSGQGRLLKTWGMESVCYDQERGIMYELGGLQAVKIDLAKAGQNHREYTGPTVMDSGNHLGGIGDSTGVASASGAFNMARGPDGDGTIYDESDAPLWDMETEQHLRTTTELPTNGFWLFEDAFRQKQPQLNSTVRFLQVFRTYTVVGEEAREVTLQVEDRKATVP